MKTQNSPIANINRLLEKRGWIDIPSSGISMYPIIKEGDICRFVPFNEDKELKKGEIILFISDYGQLVGHRFYRKYVENGVPYFLFKGDTNVVPDPPVTASQLVGKLILIRKRTLRIKPQGSIFQLWGSVVFALPALPRYCKKYLTLRKSLR